MPLDLKNKYKYRVFGLNILSCFEIPELQKAEFPTEDVRISYGQNPQSIQGALRKGVLYQSNEHSFLFRLDAVGSYLVTNGNNITVERAQESTMDEIRLFLLGPGLGALLHQRGMISLHGSCIVNNKKATLFCGISGVGKSSIAAALYKRGFPILSDDISVVVKNQNRFTVLPGISHLKLWQDGIDKLEFDSSDGYEIRPNLQKYRMPVTPAKEAVENTLENVVFLNRSNTREIGIRKLRGSRILALLKNSTYRFRYLSGQDEFKRHFEQMVQLGNTVNFYELDIPDTTIYEKRNVDFIVENLIQKHNEHGS